MPSAIHHNNTPCNQENMKPSETNVFSVGDTIAAVGGAYTYKRINMLWNCMAGTWYRPFAGSIPAGRIFKTFHINLFFFLQTIKSVIPFLKRGLSALPVWTPLAAFSLPRDRLPDVGK